MNEGDKINRVMIVVDGEIEESKLVEKEEPPKENPKIFIGPWNFEQIQTYIKTDSWKISKLTKLHHLNKKQKFKERMVFSLINEG